MEGGEGRRRVERDESEREGVEEIREGRGKEEQGMREGVEGRRRGGG